MLNPIYKILTWLVLLLGLAGSCGVSYWMKFDIDTLAYQEFVAHCEETQLKITARLKAHEQTLLGGAALFDASKKITRQEWSAYVKRLRIGDHFNGIQGLGFSLWIPATQLSAHQARIRADGFPNYKVRPEGEREAYTSIIFLEPFSDRNLRAFGYDMYSEPVRRAAMERARDENIVALSGRVTLQQETDQDVQAGTLMYAPVYKKDKPIATVEQRRAAVLGWVYSPFRMADLLNNTVSLTQQSDSTQVRLRVYDGYDTQVDHLLYDNNANHPDTESTHHRSLVKLINDFNGTVWTLQFEQIRGINGLDYSKAWITLGTGVLISILLFLLSRSYLSTRINAANIAARLTSQLQESESRFRLLADSAPVLIWLSGIDKLCYQFNQVWLDFTGRTLAQEQGNGWTEGVHPDDFQHCVDTYITAFDARLPFKMEYRLRRYDDEYRWLLNTGTPRFADDGTFLGYIGSCIDITERKQIEEALKASKVFIASILDSLSTQIAVLDGQGTIIMVNKAWQQFAEQNALPETSHNFVFYNYLNVCENAIGHDNAEEAADVLHGIMAVLAGTAQYYHTEYSCHSASEKRWFHMTVSPLQGSKRGVVVSHENITERKRMEHALKESEIKFKTVADFAYDWEYWVGKDRQIIYMSPSCEKISGYKAEEFLADNALLKKIIHPEDEKLWDNHVGKAHFFEQIHDEAELDFRIIKKDGSVAYISHLCRPIFDDKANSFGRRISNRDITERKQAEMELRIAATVFESQEGMFITDTNKVILKINKAFTLITGYSAADVIGQTPRLLYSGRHDKEFYDAMWQSIHNTGVWQGEIWNQRKNGEVYPEQLSITAVKVSNNTVTHYVATMSDITERKAMEEYIHRLAFYDALTQLPNRRLLQERLKHGIELNHRTGCQIAVLMMDLDRFKAVNDTLGHAAGDELLQQVAERVKARLREVDMVARLGGDEFVILLENVDQYEHVAHVAQSIIDTLSQPFTLYQSHEVFIGATIGIGICPRHGSSVETLMDNADAALYYAKDQGRGCFAYFSEALTQKTHERLALEHRLRSAIEQQELGIYFQPQIEISSGQLVGAEALVYWDDPVKDCRVMIKDHIALDEETETYVAISKWALRETCKLGRQWLNEDLPVVTLAVNISSYQFCHCDMKELVTEVLDDTGFPADYLGLEITETGLMGNKEHALSVLNSLNEQSVHLAIDDFGIGYSSLASLKYFPIDFLKIDKTFIKNISFSQDDAAITSTIIDMAHHLGFKVLAEGVDTSEQLAFLREQGCDRYQGCFYSNALSASDFAKLLLDLPKRVT
ncbi:MAG: CHASE domain-containing protein [Methylococcaceae bacterium]|nr:CHASE domain-containing protein [Methylococcaceae bacterium]MDD1609024.1 CHASE domain-containing protein [Methylococcaceae bacterium]